MKKIKIPETKKIKKKPKKAKRVKEKPEKPIVKRVVKPARYFEAVGRRKTAIARIRLFTRGEKLFLVNEKPYQKYFPTLELQQIVTSSLRKMNCLDKFRVLAIVKGGGFRAQAEALRHGIARVLVLFNPDFRKRLKRAGYLTRDSRMRERKKFGLKRARRAPQWQKR
jgi:small subunit ribosomal protein S9